MKVVARMVEVIGDDEWVDETIRRSVLEGVLVILPGKRLIRSRYIGTYEGITDEEIAKLEARATPQPENRPNAARIDGESES